MKLKRACSGFSTIIFRNEFTSPSNSMKPSVFSPLSSRFTVNLNGKGDFSPDFKKIFVASEPF